MVRQLIRLVALVPFLFVAPLKAAGPAADPMEAGYVDDPGGLATSDGPWVPSVKSRLVAFERATGIRVLLQFHPKSPPADEDKQPGAYMRALATRLGVIRHGVLMVYFADDPDWRVWIGDELTPVFVGKPGDARRFTESGAMHEAKEAFLTASLARADAAFAAQKKAAPPQEPLPQARRITLQADALLEGLFAKLNPR